MLRRKLAGFLMLPMMLGGCLSRQTNHLLPPAPEPPRMSLQQSSAPRDTLQELAPEGATSASARETAARK